MKIIAAAVSLFLAGSAAQTAWAGSGEAGGNGGAGGHDGRPGLPGCDGGTDPSPDGKFYIPGTRQECNPSDDDRKKPAVQPAPKTKH